MVKTMNMVLKICLLGDGAVGKTSLIRRYVENIFSEDYVPTIGTRTSKKRITINVPEIQRVFNIELLIWDLFGQLYFKRLLYSSYLNGTRGAVIMCDLTRLDTLEHLDNWVNSLSSEWRIVPMIFVANKNDLEDQYEFEVSEIEKKASTYKSPFFVTSAKTGENVQNVFKSLGLNIIQNLVDKALYNMEMDDATQ